MAVLSACITAFFELPHHPWRCASAATAASRAIDPAGTALRIPALDRHRSSAGLAFVAFLGTVLIGAALLCLWMAIEVIGYGGLLVCTAIRRGWLLLRSRSTRSRRNERWGLAVRAHGLRSRTL